MSRHTLVPILLAALLVTPGCAYLRGLGKDASETLQLGAGGSLVPGLYVWAEVPVVAAGVGWADGAWVGTDYGATSRWDQVGWGIVVAGERARGVPGASLDGWWEGAGAQAYLQQSQYLGINYAGVDLRTASSNRPIIVNKVEVGVHALFVGVTVGLDLFELADLLAGVFGWDMLGDDDFVPELAPEGDERTNPVRRVLPDGSNPNIEGDDEVS